MLRVLIKKGDNMAKTSVFLANVMDAYVYAGDQLLFVSKALTDSSINIGITADEVRAGKGNKLIGRLFHDSSFALELQDALFNLETIALNVGSAVTSGLGAGLKEEQIVATDVGKLVVVGAPQDFMNLGRLGWISTPDSDAWAKFEFDDGAATAEDVMLADGTPIEAGATYCVKYFTEAACDEVIINGEYVPSEVSVILVGDLYKASKGGSNTSSSVVGHIEIDVPRFQLNGSMDIAVNSSGAANIPFAGQALLTSDGTASCEGGGYYAKVKRIDSDADWTSNLVTIACDAAEPVTVATGATKKVNIYGVFANGTSKLLAPELLTFTMDAGTATGTTVTADGVIEAGSTDGTATLAVVVNDKSSVKASIAIVVAD